MKRVFSLISGGIIVFSLIHLAFPVRAQEVTNDNIWRDSVSVTDLGSVTANENKGDTLCEQGVMRQRQIYYSDADYAQDGSIINLTENVPPSDNQDKCILQNSRGLFGIGAEVLWSEDGNPNRALAISVTGTNIEPVPASDVVLTRTNVSGGYALGINYDLRSIGILTSDRKTPNSGLQWKLTTYADSMRYKTNDLVVFKRHAVSQNGRYLAGQLSTNNLVVIDLFSKDMRIFGAETNTITSMAVSSNGENVAIYRSGSLNIYDTGLCGELFTVGNWQQSSTLQPNCLIENLYPKIQGTYPFIGGTTTRKVRFALNGASLTIDAAWKNNLNETIWQRFEFKPDNYTPNVRGYLAMGDSFSSGEGDTQGGTWYEPGTDEQGDKNTFEGRNLCHLSRRSYPYLAAVELGYISTNTETPPENGLFHSVACSGAWIHNVIGGEQEERQVAGSEKDFKKTENQYRYNSTILNSWLPGFEKQIGYVAGRDDNIAVRNAVVPEVITIGVSGNDVGFGETIFDCIISAGTCERAQPGSKDSDNLVLLIAKQKQRLVDVYKQIKNASPDTRIYVHGYPLFVQGYDGVCRNNVRLNNDETALVQEGVLYMNTVVKAAAEEAGVFYVDITNILEGSNLCSGASDDQMAVNGITAGNDIDHPILDYLSSGICYVRTGCFGSETYHPNPRAHVKYKEAILSQTNNLQEQMPEPVKTDIPLPQQYFGQNVIAEVEAINGNSSNLSVIPEPKLSTQIVNDTFKLDEEGLLPSSTVSLYIQSDPIKIGDYIVDENGRVTEEFNLPLESLEPGVHELHLQGLDKSGNKIDWYEPIQIGHSSTDFDGDGVENNLDSCKKLTNSGVDVDKDGIDDACDGEITQPPVDPEEPPQEPEDPVVQPILNFFKKLIQFLRTLFARWW